MKALFLDRDGVINVEQEGNYILHKDAFIPYQGALEAIAIAKQYFDKIIVVTNQRGIGKGLMTDEDLHAIHQHLQLLLQNYKVQIDAFYYAPSLEDNHPLRKPNTGMGLQALQDFPEIDFSKSVMIGNNKSDMQFGKKLGMHTVFLHTTQPIQTLPNEWIDAQYTSLHDWAKTLLI